MELPTVFGVHPSCRSRLSLCANKRGLPGLSIYLSRDQMNIYSKPKHLNSIGDIKGYNNQ